MKFSSFLKITILILFILYSHEKLSQNDKCYVLANGGGADRGAYGAGVIKDLIDNLSANEIRWNVVTGISIGSLNAAGVAVWEIGKEKEAAEFIVDGWLSLKGKENLYKNWRLGLLWGLLFKSSFYDNSPYYDTVKEIFLNKSLKRGYICGAVNLVTGDYEIFEDESLKESGFPEIIITSAAVPVFFPVNKYNSNYYIDGSSLYNIDITSGINRCLHMGYSEDKIVVDAIFLSSSISNEINPKTIGPLGVLRRTLEISRFDKSVSDLIEAMEYFSKVEFRYLVKPTMQLPEGIDLIDFTHEDVVRMIGYGQDDAKRAILKGHGVNMKEVIYAYKEKRNGRKHRSVTNNNSSMSFLE